MLREPVLSGPYGVRWYGCSVLVGVGEWRLRAKDGLAESSQELYSIYIGPTTGIASYVCLSSLCVGSGSRVSVCPVSAVEICNKEEIHADH